MNTSQTLTYTSATLTWNPPASWLKDNTIIGIIVMYGEADIPQPDRDIIRMHDCSARFIRITPTTMIKLRSATALLWKTDSSQIENIPCDTKLILDETSATVVHNVFFEHNRSAAHKETALRLICYQLQNIDTQNERVQLPLPLTGQEPNQTQVTLITNYLQRHLDEPITLDRLAEEFNSSKSQITKNFLSEKGETPAQTLARLRLKHAKHLLQNTDRTISQVAYATGYQDLAGFSHFFKKHTDYSPSEFRDNCRWLV
jgi:YesN/AraC family two-component response regulator